MICLLTFIEILLIIIFLIVFTVILVGIFYKPDEKDVEKAKQLLNSLGILDFYEIVHIYGHPYINTNTNVYLVINNDNNLYLYKTWNDVMSKTNEMSKIPINQITRYELKTESEIQKDVTLARLLVLGVLAFGLKKKTEINNTYFILSYVQNNVPIDCIFKNTVNNQQLGNIISTLNRLKIEQNGIQSN